MVDGEWYIGATTILTFLLLPKTKRNNRPKTYRESRYTVQYEIIVNYLVHTPLQHRISDIDNRLLFLKESLCFGISTSYRLYELRVRD